MTDETDVRTWLATAEVPDLRLDFEETVRNGRTNARRRRVRRMAGTGALAIAVVLAVPGVVALAGRDNTDAPPPLGARRSPPPDGPFTCTYKALPDPSGLDALGGPGVSVELEIGGMDPSGRYIFGTANGGNHTMPVLWDNGVGRVISPELDGSRPMGVSAEGVVVGYRASDGGVWIYRDGTITEVPKPAGASHFLIGKMNAAGDLLGTVYTSAPFTSKVAVWRVDDLANPEVLSAPAEETHPVAFLADGGVLGAQQLEGTAYVWNAQRQGRALTLPGGTFDMLIGAGNGWVYGVGRRSGQSDRVPFRWKADTGEAEWIRLPAALPPGPDTELKAVGENGALLFVVVTRRGTPPLPYPVSSYVVRGEHVVKLPGGKTNVIGMDQYGTKVVGAMTPGDNAAGGEWGNVVWTC